MSGRAGDGDEAFRLYGTRKVEIAPQRLRAGRLTADLSNGNLRTIAYDGIEALRAISFLVRDRDWGTYDPAISGLTVEENADGFRVSYMATCNGPGGVELRVDATIEGQSSGLLTFQAEALTETGFETNRCGFCVLHPIVGLAGAPVVVEHVDGAIIATHLPDLIEPWQPFKQMRAITHTVADGLRAECRMEGDAFEMEDQRNWSDASYKTYVRPLEMPWPYRIDAGRPVRQHVSLTIRDDRATHVATSSSDKAVIYLTSGTASGIMPSIGLVIAPEEAEDVEAIRRVISTTGVQELLFHFDPCADHGIEALKDFSAVATGHRGTTTVEIALPCKLDAAVELMDIAALMRSVGLMPDAVVVSPSVDRQSTPPGSAWPACPPLQDVYRAARRAFPDVALGGGMLSYFTELNRKRVPADTLDFISHCTNPIIHAADDLSVMQTLEALPFIIKSARAIYGDKPYRIGPSTIAMRQNPYGSRTMDNPDVSRIPMANRDPRHNGVFGAAFALGYAARVIPAGLDRLTLSAAVGPFGLVAGKNEPVDEGAMRPLAEIVGWMAQSVGHRWTECHSSSPDRMLAFLTRGVDDRDTLWVVNLTAGPQTIDFHALSGSAPVMCVHENAAVEMACQPSCGQLIVPAFATCRLQWRSTGVMQS